MKKRNKRIGFEVNIGYSASGYYNGSESTGMHSFYYLTDSISEACKRALEDFNAYWIVKTRNPYGNYYKLDYEIKDINFGKRILD